MKIDYNEIRNYSKKIPLKKRDDYCPLGIVEKYLDGFTRGKMVAVSMPRPYQFCKFLVDRGIIRASEQVRIKEGCYLIVEAFDNDDIEDAWMLTQDLVYLINEKTLDF